MIFGLKIEDLSTITIVILGAITLFDKIYNWYVGPHKYQDQKLKKTEEKQKEQEDRINQLTFDFAEMKSTLNKIKDNHLVHLQEDVNKLKESNVRINTNLEWIINKLNGQE